MPTTSVAAKRVHLEVEREGLYLQLDEEAEEINQQSQYIKNHQILEQKHLIANTRRN